MSNKIDNRFILTPEAINKHGTIPEILLLLALRNGLNYEKDLQTLTNKYLISPRYISGVPTGEYFLMDSGIEVLNKIQIDSTENIPTEEVILPLALQLQSLYPGGKKPGTNQYWKGNKKEIIVKLQGFYKRYGNEYTPEQIVEATKQYVDSFNGQYAYMQLLKYFIWKDMPNGEKKSELASYLENEGVDSVGMDWTSELK